MIVLDLLRVALPVAETAQDAQDDALQDLIEALVLQQEAEIAQHGEVARRLVVLLVHAADQVHQRALLLDVARHDEQVAEVVGELQRVEDLHRLAVGVRVQHLLDVVPVHAHELLQVRVVHAIALVVPQRVVRGLALAHAYVVQLVLQRRHHVLLHSLVPDEVVRRALAVQAAPEPRPVGAQRCKQGAHRHVLQQGNVLIWHGLLVAHSRETDHRLPAVQSVHQRGGEDAHHASHALVRASHRQHHHLLARLAVRRGGRTQCAVKVVQEYAVFQQRHLVLMQLVAAAVQEESLQQLHRVRCVLARAFGDVRHMGCYGNHSLCHLLRCERVASVVEQSEEEVAGRVAGRAVLVLWPVQKGRDCLQTRSE